MKKLLLLIPLLSVLTGCMTKLDDAKRSYDYAFKKCGKENIQQHDYTDGSKYFDCKDYSNFKN